MSNYHERLAQVSDILTLPDVVMKINNLIDGPDTSASDIANIISSDIALSTKILKLVNAPFYGFSKQITSINYAIVILGFNAVRNLALTAYVMDIKSNDAGGFDSKAFWEFSINNAIVTEFLTSAAIPNEKNDAYIAGLVHDIGVVILNQYFPDEFYGVFYYAQEHNCTLLEAELQLLHFTHIDIGCKILDTWNLPEKIVNVCKYYSVPNETTDILPSLVHISNIICRGLKLGNPADMSIPAINEEALKRIGISSTDLSPILQQVLDKTVLTSSLLKKNG